MNIRGRLIVKVYSPNFEFICSNDFEVELDCTFNYKLPSINLLISKT